MLYQLFASLQYPYALVLLAQTIPLIRIGLEFAKGNGPRQLAGLQEFSRRNVKKIDGIENMPLLIDKRQIVEIQNEYPSLKILQLRHQPVITADISFVLRRPYPYLLLRIPVE